MWRLVPLGLLTDYALCYTRSPYPPVAFGAVRLEAPSLGFFDFSLVEAVAVVLELPSPAPWLAPVLADGPAARRPKASRRLEGTLLE